MVTDTTPQPGDSTETLLKKILTILAQGGGGGSVDWGAIGGVLSAQADLQSALDAKAGETETTNSLAEKATRRPTIITEASTTPAMDSTWEQNIVNFDNAAAISLELLQDSAFAAPVGWTGTGVQADAGVVTISNGTGATVLFSGGKDKTTGQNAVFSFMKVAANTWLVFGDLEA